MAALSPRATPSLLPPAPRFNPAGAEQRIASARERYAAGLIEIDELEREIHDALRATCRALPRALALVERR